MDMMDSLEETTIPSSDVDTSGNTLGVPVAETSHTVIDEPSYTVKVSGEEYDVPLSELVNGYSRQQDYTRKTQELAAERERLSQAERLVEAFDTDPVRTLEALSEAYGVSLGGRVQEQQEEEYVDPEEARLRQIESFMQFQQEREISSYIDSQFANIESRHGFFDRDALADFMVEYGIRDFEVAYDAMVGRQARSARAQSDAQAQANKANLVSVAGGHGVQSGTVMSGSPERPGSIRDAFNAARSQHGI